MGRSDANELNMPKSSTLPAEAPLLAWYDENRRDLPWRHTTDPYRIWISEIMLQQTRVEAVISYYKRFLNALPTIQDLAAADEDLCLKLWEGLGYYSRIRNMHRAAKVVVDELGGVMPDARDNLLKLPGIGDYTASAIAAISFRERTPAVDGNLLRVFSRVTHYDCDIKKPADKKAATTWYLSIMSDERPGDFNQALMDLGATVCMPKVDPACYLNAAACPWSSFCLAYQNRDASLYPPATVKKNRRIENRTVLLIRYGDSIALQKRKSKGLLAGMFQFPNVPDHLSEDEALEVVKSLRFSPLHIKKLPASRHIFSHLEWHMIGYEIRADEWLPEPSAPGEAMPLTSEIKENGMKYDCNLPIILADADEVRNQYSIPTAFHVYRDVISSPF